MDQEMKKAIRGMVFTALLFSILLCMIASEIVTGTIRPFHGRVGVLGSFKAISIQNSPHDFYAIVFGQALFLIFLAYLFIISIPKKKI